MDVALPFGAALAALSTAAQGRWSVKLDDTRIVPGVLYVAVVGPSGSGKSPAMKILFGPLIERENEKRHYAEQENRNNKVKFDCYDSLVKDQKRKLKRLVERNDSKAEQENNWLKEWQTERDRSNTYISCERVY